MSTRILAALSIFAFMSLSQDASAQNVIRDYVKEYPVHYQPSDPWNRGVVFRNHTGHGGMFYNCDQEECKRNNPYLIWKSQPYQCIPRRPIRSTINQQICEVKQRILWGGSGCFSCETPACAQGCNQCGACQSCQNGGNTAPSYYDRAYSDQPYMTQTQNRNSTRQASMLDRLAIWSNGSGNRSSQQEIKKPFSQYNQPLNEQQAVEYRQSRYQQPSQMQNQRTNTIRVAQQPTGSHYQQSQIESAQQSRETIVQQSPRRGMKVIR